MLRDSPTGEHTPSDPTSHQQTLTHRTTGDKQRRVLRDRAELQRIPRSRFGLVEDTSLTLRIGGAIFTNPKRHSFLREES
jgi:hypothetical protein